MSTFFKLTKHPKTKEWQVATWMDDYHGKHRYGVRFPSGEVFDPEKIKLKTKEHKIKIKKEKLKQEFNQSSFEEGFATARRIYEPVIVQILNVNGDSVTQKINKY